jgi:hypothetical protein
MHRRFIGAGSKTESAAGMHTPSAADPARRQSAETVRWSGGSSEVLSETEAQTGTRRDLDLG